MQYNCTRMSGGLVSVRTCRTSPASRPLSRCCRSLLWQPESAGSGLPRRPCFAGSCPRC
jgi:hypothetical protein